MHTFRISFFLTCLCVTGFCATAQEKNGILGDVDGTAEDYLIDYVVKGEAIDGDFVCVGRGACTGINVPQSIVRDVEIWVVEARLGKNASLSAMCRQGYSDGASSGTPYWEQTLIWDADRYYRRSSTGTARGLNLSEKADTPIERSTTQRSLPTITPYFLPFVESATFLKSRNGLASAEKFLARFELDKAKREEGGVLGEWLLRNDGVVSCRVSILFNEKQGNKPTKVTWKFPEGKKGQEKAGFRVRMASETKWQNVPVEGSKEGKMRWLPRTVHRIDYLGAENVSETNFVFNWGRIDKKEFPLPTDEDWRSPFAAKFDIDWDEPYQSFLRRFEKNRN